MKRRILLATMVAACVTAWAQNNVLGKITDNNHAPLAGAIVKLDAKATATDGQGNYYFTNVAQGEHQLVISFLGYATVTDRLTVTGNTEKSYTLQPTEVLTDEVIVKATRANENSPLAFTNVSKDDIQRQNFGQDLPYLLSLTPSMVVTSDAGTGVGYTGFRIRGTDANRINVTVNSIPLNDAESQSVFWVNMPDFASSLNSVQVQRGVGTSTQGSGAFGASINMKTNGLENEPYAEASSSYGSFNTLKNTVKVGTGLLNNHFTFDARLSKISSDGYVDRATSELKSYYVSGGYYANKTIIRVNIFSGKEKTYQSWNGVPKVRLENDEEGMQRYEDHGLYTHDQTENMKNSDSRTFNLYTYDNQTDNYQQDHYQMLLSQKIGAKFNLNAALHYTYGRGYYENYEADAKLADYGLTGIIMNNDTIKNSNLVNQKWLDNDFYGGTLSMSYTNNNIETTVGGGWNQYDGRHFGKVIWAQYLGDAPKDYQWYHGTGLKTDYNVYAKVNAALFNKKANAYADLQLRHINHDITGTDNDMRDITQSHDYTFFNPKFGITVTPDKHQQAFLSVAVAHREPNRSNFTDIDPGDPTPQPERLLDFEMGYKYQTEKWSAGINLYDMEYNSQLVLTGRLNDVGSAIMTNVKESYRRGIEMIAGAQITSQLTWDVNATLSSNKIVNFVESVDNWDTGTPDLKHFDKTDISFSPDITASSLITYKPIVNMAINWTSQYVGQQYIDNSSSSDRQLNAYWVNNLNISYTIMPKVVKSISFSLAVNNFLNEQYESNAWVYSYIYGGQRYAMDGYFPQAGINLMSGITVRF
jgi:iron complex outermembrane receptor protein